VLELLSKCLRVVLLDPEADRELLGTRFCSGGYIWTVEDATAGPLLSGPEGSEHSPHPFNGRGLPEAFRHRTRAGQPLTWNGDRALAPGIGVVARDDQDQLRLLSSCTWTIEQYQDRMVFTTEQQEGNRGYTLSRMVQIVDRDVLSVTRFSNVGQTVLALQWFAHPFFMLDPIGRTTAELPIGTRISDNSVFHLEGNTLRMRRHFDGQHDGEFAQLHLPRDHKLHTRISHPLVGSVRFETSFVPSECPIWANGHTFSIEPYQTLQLEPIESRQWTLRYRFGPA
jgi:hypothetical protein